ncbi:YDG domain-containing protein, partial [Polynucleobacter sp. MWH-Berg-3C6]|uniref:YDG domain-containing protein n=1 Tax=Polynucleobacter sp. MWH-Berg-3C6 TaxID=1855882 RepID=UPI002105E878
DAGNYKFTYNNANLVITPYIIDPSSSSGPNIAATANNKVYDTTTTATGALTMTGLLAGDVVNANYANANFANANVGTAKTVTFSGITLSGPAAANYVMSTAQNAGPVTATANITPAPVYITGGLTAQNKVYDTTTAATVTAGNAVTLSGVLGSDTVTAPSAGNYANSFAFSQANVANNLTVTPVLNNNGAVAGSLALGGAQAANYYIAGVNIIPSLVANITPKPVYITAGLTAQDKVYDATTVAHITAGAQTLSGVYFADQSNVSVASTGTYTGTFASPSVNQGAAWAVAPNTSSTTINGVGYTTVTGTSLSGSAAGNYYIAGVSQSLSANITPAPLTITANNAASFVTQNLSALGYTVNGLLGSDAVASATTAAVVSSTNSTALSFSTGAGTYATTVTGATGSGLANYTITYNPGVYTIVPAGQLLITTTGTTTPYGTAGTIPVPTVSYQTTGNVVISNLVAGTPVTTNGITTYTYSDGAGTNISFSLAPTGTTLSGSGNINVGTYGLVANSFTKTGGNLTSSSAVVTGDYNVVPLAVTITATPRSVVYSGAAQNQLAYTTSTPILSGDYVAVTGLASGTNVGTYNSSLVVGGTTSGNNTNDYTFTLVDKPLTITPYIINFGSGSGPSISATAQSKQYDTTTTTSGSLTMGNLLSANDQVTASYGAANFDNANVGTAKTVTFTGIVLAGPGSGNYQIGVAPVTATANITPAPVYITGGLTAQNKVYDTTTAA